MNWACIIFDAMSIFLNIKQLISDGRPMASGWPGGGLGLRWGGVGLPWRGLAGGVGINEKLSGISGPAGWGWLGLAG